MKSSGDHCAWEPGGLASLPPPALDTLTVPGELFHPSKNCKLHRPGQDI